LFNARQCRKKAIGTQNKKIHCNGCTTTRNFKFTCNNDPKDEGITHLNAIIDQKEKEIIHLNEIIESQTEKITTLQRLFIPAD
jgi:hypothetical protein